MPMPDDWVQSIFAKLIATYGVRFMSAYGEMAPELVRASWAETLDGMTSGHVAHALKHLDPDWPPNALQFRRLAHGAPRPMPKALPAPKANPDHVRALVDRMQQVTGPRDPRAWARALRARNQRELTRAQRVAWQSVLGGADAGDTSTIGTDDARLFAGFQPVPLPTLQTALRERDDTSGAGQQVDEVSTDGGGGRAGADPPGGIETGGRGPEKIYLPPSQEEHSISDPDTLSTTAEEVPADFWDTP